MAGVPLVRSAGHGISLVYDAAGRVVARANSKDGPVALVADVPIIQRTAMAKSESKAGLADQQAATYQVPVAAGRPQAATDTKERSEHSLLNELILASSLLNPRSALA